METKIVAILSPNCARYFTVSPTGDYPCCWQLVNCAQNEMNGMQVCVPHSNAQPTAACSERHHLPGQPQAGGDEAFHTAVTLVEGDIGISPLLQL